MYNVFLYAKAPLQYTGVSHITLCLKNYDYNYDDDYNTITNTITHTNTNMITNTITNKITNMITNTITVMNDNIASIDLLVLL